jgi:cytochrome b6-f complex iron-sulfur subunit/menaquinol-cytochrome c reductase iron-sulfur subunit
MTDPKSGAAPMPKPPTPGAPDDPDRRGALGALVVVGGAAYAGALAVPAALFLTSGSSGEGGSRRERWIRVGRLADLLPGEPRRLTVVGDERDAFTVTKDQMIGSVWVIREGDQVRAFSATCPHLGCAVDLAADKKGFACPCHTSRFALSGAAESGPSPRGMDPLRARIVGDSVEIDFRRFRIGISERTEVGA